MPMSYQKLWKLLIDRNLNKKQLGEISNLSQYTINKLTRTETVTTQTLEKICSALKVDIGDVCEIVLESNEFRKEHGHG